MRHYLVKPQGKRKSFSIFARVTHADGSTKDTNLKLPDIDAINQKFKAGVYSFKEASTHAAALCLRLNVACGAEEFKEQPNLYNMKLLDDYWKKEYSFRELRHESNAWNKLRRAVEAVGDLSLATADRSELQLKVKNLELPQDTKRKLTNSINQLLKHAKRDFTLILPKKKRRPLPDHLTMEEFLQTVPNIDNLAVRCAAWVAFSAGLRVGEVLGFESSSYIESQQVVYVESQLDKDHEIADTKNGIARHAFVFECGIEWIKKWDSYREECVSLGHYNVTKILKRACRKTFPHDTSKHCTMQDLRHSYAIMLVPIVGFDLTAQSMGHSVQVCQEYYGGLALSKQGIAAIKMKVDQSIKEKESV